MKRRNHVTGHHEGPRGRTMVSRVRGRERGFRGYSNIHTGENALLKYFLCSSCRIRIGGISRAWQEATSNDGHHVNQGLFDSLAGQFLDGTPVTAVPQNRRRVVSVMDHLNRMFNTREGSVAHLRDYGLPDVADIYRRMPDGIEELRQAIKRTVEHYEPRLENVRVVRREAEGHDPRLAFILSGELRGGGGSVRFETTFTSIGRSSIAPWKRPVID